MHPADSSSVPSNDVITDVAVVEQDSSPAQEDVNKQSSLSVLTIDVPSTSSLSNIETPVNSNLICQVKPRSHARSKGSVTREITEGFIGHHTTKEPEIAEGFMGHHTTEDSSIGRGRGLGRGRGSNGSRKSASHQRQPSQPSALKVPAGWQIALSFHIKIHVNGSHLPMSMTRSPIQIPFRSRRKMLQ
jgi:hypothetical protein